MTIQAAVERRAESSAPVMATIPWTNSSGWSRAQYYETIRAGDVNGDGKAEILARSAHGVDTWAFDAKRGSWEQLAGATPPISDDSGWGRPEYYTTLRLGDVNDDGKAELVARSAAGIKTWAFNGRAWESLSVSNPSWSDAEGWGRPECYSTIALADIDGDGCDELLARSDSGIEAWKFDSDKDEWKLLSQDSPGWSNAAGWDRPQCYSTIRFGDIDGDGKAEMLARSADGVDTWSFDGLGWAMLSAASPAISDAAGWAHPQYYSTLRLADVDGDGRDELVARSPSGMQTWKFDVAAGVWNRIASADPPLSDSRGWSDPQYYETILLADVDGDGRAELMARSPQGLSTWGFGGGEWSLLDAASPDFSDAAEWNRPEHYRTIRLAPYNGAGKALVAARSSSGVGFYSFGDRGPKWRQFPTMGPVPNATPENVAKLKANLAAMDQFVKRCHDWFQDHLLAIFALLQVSDADPGQEFATSVLSAAFEAIGSRPVPGAPAISGLLGGIHDRGAANDSRGELNRTFPNVLQRFGANSMELTRQIALYKNEAQKYWRRRLKNPATGEEVVLGDLASVEFPPPATGEFEDLLDAALAAGRYRLWQRTLPKRWNAVGMRDALDLRFQDEAACRSWVEAYVRKHKGCYLTCRKVDATWPNKGVVWRVQERWLGHGPFPFAHQDAPGALCDELFQDDGAGKIVRSTSITTRADVFNNWGLPFEEVALPSYGPHGPVLRAAILSAEAEDRPVLLNSHKLAGLVAQGAGFRGASFRDSSMPQAQLAKADLSSADLSSTDLSEADLSSTSLERVGADSVNLRGARLEFAVARGARLRGANLAEAQAQGAFLRDADLRGANLRSAVLRGADLRDADLTDADLTEADLAGADLRGARLSGAVTALAMFRGADLRGVVGLRLTGDVETAFAEGEFEPNQLPSHSVRCAGEATNCQRDVDPGQLHDAAHALAGICGGRLVDGFRATLEGFQDALNVFSSFSIALDGSERDDGSLALSFGMAGPTFYRKTVAALEARGVPRPRAAELAAAGLATHYPALGCRLEIVGSGEKVQAQFQGPTGSLEVERILSITGAQAASGVLSAALGALDRASVALTSIDFSTQNAGAAEFFFVAPAGDASVVSALLHGLGVRWSDANALEAWLMRSRSPYLLSAGVPCASSAYQVGVYLPVEAQRLDAFRDLLDAASWRRLSNLGDLAAQHPLQVSYIGFVRRPDGSTRVTAEAAFG